MRAYYSASPQRIARVAAAMILFSGAISVPYSRAAESRDVELRAADGVRVFADHVRIDGGGDRPILLLFHQAGSNTTEYAPMLARLGALGFDALAVDSRSGGRMFNRNNRTVMALGRAQPFDAAYADLQAALVWAEKAGYSEIVAWGSSYTAALVFRLAAEYEQVRAVLSFSPGEHLGAGERVRGYASRVRVPVFVTSAPGVEVREARRILDMTDPALVTQFEPRVGVHGSSALRTDRNPDGFEAYWTAVEAFLVGPALATKKPSERVSDPVTESSK
jgi:dienelactone hydrolase